MSDKLRSIARALISVSDKTGLIDFAKALAARNIEIVSTGGTHRALVAAGIAARDVSELTGFPEMMDGRVKTLHPKVHGGLLAIRENPEHEAAMLAHGIAPIDLLVVNLYPFEATVASGADFDECVENIDIGGPAMIRAAAKNHRLRHGDRRCRRLCAASRGTRGEGGTTLSPSAARWRKKPSPAPRSTMPAFPTGSRRNRRDGTGLSRLRRP